MSHHFEATEDDYRTMRLWAVAKEVHQQCVEENRDGDPVTAAALSAAAEASIDALIARVGAPRAKVVNTLAEMVAQTDG